MNVTNQNQEIDTLKVTQNEDGSYTLDWHPDDPKWNWLNGLTRDQVQIIMEQAIKDYLEELKDD